MTDDELQKLRDAEGPVLRELRDKQAQLRSVLAALNDLPASRWPEQLKTAVSLCDREDVAVAKSLWLVNIARRYDSA